MNRSSTDRIPPAPHRVRCAWCGTDPLYVAYHDEEWGVPERDDRRLFELLVLEGAQAGLSWLTVLRRREGYRRAFEGFDPARVAAYGPADRARLLADPGIIRNRLKVDATVRLARAVLDIQAARGSLAAWLWDFVDGLPVRNAWPDLSAVPAESPASAAMSRALRARGCAFVGPVICHAFMQAAGMVNDHVTGCFRHAEVDALRGK